MNKMKLQITSNKYILDEFMPPKYEEIVSKIAVNENEISQVYESLIDNGEIINIGEGIYLLKETYDSALKILIDYLDENESITASKYRDLLNTNRKVSIGLLECFDKDKVTKRIDDKRVFY